ncbi:MAG: CHAD domain-containing protein [Verrucomicrobiota bacterium]
MSTTTPCFRKNGPDFMSGPRSPCDLPANSLRLLEKSLKRQWRCYRKQLNRCQKQFTEKTIHDSRVEARRLLSTVELLGGFLSAARVRKVERALKQHLGTFDGLRDTQVQLPLIERLQRTFPAARPFYAFVQERENRLVKSTRKNIKKVGTQRLDRLIAACRDEVQTRRKKCPPEKAVDLLLESVDRAFTCAGQLRARIDPRDTDTIHRARVAFKKFRYMVETLVPCLPRPAPKLLEAMRHYQTMMGRIQDAEMLRLALEKFLRKHPLAPEPARHLREALLLRRQRLIDIYMGATEQMRRFWPWNGLAWGAPAAAPKSTSRSL